MDKREKMMEMESRQTATNRASRVKKKKKNNNAIHATRPTGPPTRLRKLSVGKGEDDDDDEK